MDEQFWLECWEQNRTRFHKSQAHPLLVPYFDQLDLAKDQRVFVPLCGKTLDIAWLLAQGMRVAGAELSEIAIAQLFEAFNIEPEITAIGDLKRYSVANLDIFVGNILKLTPDVLGEVDAVFDRAALVALPDEMRVEYAKHLKALTDDAPQLLITYVYDQTLVDGPPFSVGAVEIEQHYGDVHQIERLDSVDVELKEIPAQEVVWILK